VPALDPPRPSAASAAPRPSEPSKPTPPKKPEGLPLFPDNREAIEAEVEQELAKALGNLSTDALEVEVDVDEVAAARGAPDSGEMLVDLPPAELRRPTQEGPVNRVSSGVYRVQGLGGPDERPAEEAAAPVVDEPPKAAGAGPSKPPSDLADLIERDKPGEAAKAGTDLVFETVEGAEGGATPSATTAAQQPRQAHWSPDGASALASARAGLSRRTLLLIGAGVALLAAGGVALLVHLL